MSTPRRILLSPAAIAAMLLAGGLLTACATSARQAEAERRALPRLDALAERLGENHESHRIEKIPPNCNTIRRESWRNVIGTAYDYHTRSQQDASMMYSFGFAVGYTCGRLNPGDEDCVQRCNQDFDTKHKIPVIGPYASRQNV